MAITGDGSGAHYWHPPEDENDSPQYAPNKRLRQDELDLPDDKRVKKYRQPNKNPAISHAAKEVLEKRVAPAKAALNKKRVERAKPDSKTEFTNVKQGPLKRTKSSESSNETTKSASSHESPPVAPKKVATSTHQLAKELLSLEKQPVSPEILPLIFKLGSQLQNDKKHEKLANRMLDKAKAFIKEHPNQYAVQAAANKGKAAVVGMQAVAATIGMGKELKANVASAQEVILLPKHNAVLKRMDALAKEETYLVDSLFDLQSQQSVVGTFTMNSVDYQAKPFLAMSTFGDVKYKTTALETVLQRLEPDSEFNAILTGEIQLLDLHSDNLGLTCVLPEECDRFSQFRLPDSSNKPMHIKDFILKHLSGELSEDTTVQYKEAVTKNGKTEEKNVEIKVRDLPQELKKALDCPWKFVIFDTDTAIAEDNRLQVQITDGNKEHLIPLRNCLLQTAWKNSPLSHETIDRMLNSDDRDEQVKSWVQRDDAPIYKQLPHEKREELRAIIEPRIEAYSLSQIRAEEGASETTLTELRKTFVADLCKDTKQNRALWKFLETNLEMSGETKYDITSRSLAARIRRNDIAHQLFPRLTSRQQEALFERQKNRTAYLESFQELASTKATGNALLNELEEYIKLPQTPLNSARKQELLQLCNHLKHFDETSFSGAIAKYVWGNKETRIESLKNTITQECQPTFFNVMKAMYPLLADVYELAKAAYSEDDAGSCIGHFEYTIEQIIPEVRSKYFWTSPGLMQIADKVEQQIREIENPSFFGVWDTPKSGEEGSAQSRSSSSSSEGSPMDESSE